MRRIILLFLAILSLGSWASAQRKPLKTGIGMLGAAYMGDMNNNGTELYKFYPGINASFEFASHRRVVPQLCGGYGKFVAQNRDLGVVEGIRLNTFVETSFFFADLRIKYRFRKDRKIIPYLSAGFGLLNYTPHDIEGNGLSDNISTRPDGEIYSSLAASLPLTAGCEFKLSPLLSVSMEANHRRSGTDFLDNIGSLGTRKGNDHLNTASITMHLTFDPEQPINIGNRNGRQRTDD